MMFLLMLLIFTSHLFSFFPGFFFLSKCISSSAAEVVVVRSHHNCAAVELAHGRLTSFDTQSFCLKIVHNSLDCFVLLNIAFCGTVFGATFLLSVP